MVAVIAALVFLSVYQSQQQAYDRALIGMTNVATTLSESFVRIIETTDLGLISLNDEIERQTKNGGIDPQKISAFISRQDGLHPNILGFRVYGADGKLDYAVHNVVNPQATLANRGYFEHLKDTPDLDFLVTAPFFGNATQQWSLGAVRKISNPDGSFGGVVYGAIPTQLFETLFAGVNVGKKGVIALYHQDFSLAARFPHTSEADQVMGRQAMTPMMHDFIVSGQPSIHYEYTSTIDHVQRLAQIQRVPGTPYYIVIGLAKDDFLGGWRQDARLHVLTGLLMIFMVGTVMFISYRYIQKWQNSTKLLKESEEKFRLLLQCASDGIHIINDQGYIIEVSDSFCQMLGYGHDQMIGMHVTQWDVKFSSDEVAQNIQAFLNSTSMMTFETRHRCQDGHVIEVEITSYPVQIVDQTVLFLASRDISLRKSAEEELRLAAMVYEKSGEAICITDAFGTIISVNAAFTVLTGYSKDEAVGQNMRLLNSGRHKAEFYEGMWASLHASGHWQGEIWNRRKNGEIYPERLTINTIFDKDGTVSRRVALFSDITEQKESHEAIWRYANFDALTGLPNRHTFLDRLAQGLKKSQRTGHGLAVILMDLDRFKEVNDSLGHIKGDLLLKETAKRLALCVRETDVIGRLGGDEFVILLDELNDTVSVDRIAGNILRAIAVPYTLGAEPVYISVSLGIALYPEDAGNTEDLLKSADQAMYESKNLGRNRYNYFKPAMQEASLHRVAVVSDLRNAIAENQFELYYQPIVDLKTGAIPKAEALIRWNHPVRGLVMPASFIPIAEETGLIVHIGEWVFQQAARQAAYWHHSQISSIQISVNKSPIQFREPLEGSVSWVDYLESLGLKGDSITVEITEGLLLDANEKINSQLLGFRDAGIQVSLDDFGTGYSSLAYLKKFDIDYLKIDQSFVKGLSANSSDLALCEAIIVMAHKLGMKVIAEGIETIDQRDLLHKAGCDYGQGYLFSRPVSAVEFERVLSGQIITHS